MQNLYKKCVGQELNFSVGQNSVKRCSDVITNYLNTRDTYQIFHDIGIVRTDFKLLFINARFLEFALDEVIF